MRTGRFTSLLALAAMLASCGGGDGSSGGSATPTPSPAATGTPTPTGGTACSLSARQQFALTQLQEWYLFPDLLDSSVNPSSFNDLQDYIDALVAPARAQSRDRYFTYVTSIAEENAFFGAGSSAGFGIRLGYDSTARRLYVMEAYENTPALAAGLDRGTEITGVGTSTADIQPVTSLFASGGAEAVSGALGPSTAGTTRVLQVRQPDGTVATLTVSKRDYNLLPVSSRYGVKVLTDGTRRVGYINLRTFVDTAGPALATAFDTLRSQGITEVIVDLRYNGGGLVSVSETLSSLLNAQRTGQVLSYTTFRPSKSSENSTSRFTTQAQGIAATKVAFIGTGGTASASELVMNAQKAYLGANAALIGSNTYGKPVGQIAIDRAACDDRLRIIAFRTENANHEGDYYTGLASRMNATCQAADDILHPLGDPQENSIKVALDYLAGRTCTPIATAGIAQQSVSERRVPLESTRPTAVQRELPGIY